MVLLLFIALASMTGGLAWASEKSLRVLPTEDNHANPDKVLVTGSGKRASVRIVRDRGIGSTKIAVPASWRGNLRVVFEDFGNLESFVVNNGTQCINGALGPHGEFRGKWEDGHCNCAYAKPQQDLVKMRSDGKNIKLEIPADFLRSKDGIMLGMGWIDAYRN